MAHSTPIATTRSASGIATGKLAVWWVVASEIVIFAGLIGGYLFYRLKYDHWSSDALNTSTFAGALNTFILLTSSLFAVLAHHYAEKKDTKAAFKYLWFTIFGALLFLTVKSIEWSTEIHHGFTITAAPFWSFYYTIAGLHALHIIGGAIIMVFISLDVRKGKNLHRVELIGIYWHFVDIVWIFLFPLLYIAK